jgi:hypothetical protein
MAKAIKELIPMFPVISGLQHCKTGLLYCQDLSALHYVFGSAYNELLHG